MKTAIVCYVPPQSISAKICNPRVFLQNLRQFKTSHELVLYSDENWPDMAIKIPSPEKFVDRDAKLKNGAPNAFVLNNFIFFTGLRIALRKGITHMLYLEADCRFGRDHWDEILFDFHFKHPKPLVASGTAVSFNVCSAGRSTHLDWKNWERSQRTLANYPLPCFGWGGQSYTTEKPTVFVNGALGVYDVVWLQKLFGMDGLPSEQTKDNCKHLAENTFAWDFAIGYELYKRMESHSFDVIANNPFMYSGYGDSYTTPGERMEMLRNGTVCAVHQIKGNETI